MVYKSVNGLAPDYLSEMFVDRSNITNYTLRDTIGKLAIPQPRTKYLKKIVLVTVVRYCGIPFLQTYGRLALYVNSRLIVATSFDNFNIFTPIYIILIMHGTHGKQVLIMYFHILLFVMSLVYFIVNPDESTVVK